jgi:hypothetical protein
MLLAELLDSHAVHHFIVEPAIGIDHAAQAALKLKSKAFMQPY